MNMMNVAEDLIKRENDIKKVLILEHPPRFDIKSRDPLSLKPELARFANSFYQQLWFESKSKHRIVLGKHNLGCSEKVQLDRFTDRFNNRYDGIHMNSKEGKIAYTESVMCILSRHVSPHAPSLRPRPGPDSSSNQNNCAQTKPMRAPQTESFSQSSSVPVQNRFTVLGN